MLSGIPWTEILAWFDAHQHLLGWSVFTSIAMFLGTLVAVPFIIVALPANYLKERQTEKPLPVVWHGLFVVLKNVLGAGLALAGLVMLVLPGQGLLTLFIGLGLMNFPGKRRLVIRLISQKRVFNTINRLRLKAGKAPLDRP